jgi:hypothetical protein
MDLADFCSDFLEKISFWVKSQSSSSNIGRVRAVQRQEKKQAKTLVGASFSWASSTKKVNPV